MNTFKFPRSVTINLKCNGSQQQAIGNQSTLDGKTIKCILSRVPAAAGAKTSVGVDVALGLENVYLQLANSANEIIHDALPLQLLDPKTNGTGQVVELNSASIDWTKTRIVWGDAAAAATASGKEIPLLVVYE